MVIIEIQKLKEGDTTQVPLKLHKDDSLFFNNINTVDLHTVTWFHTADSYQTWKFTLIKYKIECTQKISVTQV